MKLFLSCCLFCYLIFLFYTIFQWEMYEILNSSYNVAIEFLAWVTSKLEQESNYKLVKNRPCLIWCPWTELAHSTLKSRTTAFNYEVCLTLLFFSDSSLLFLLFSRFIYLFLYFSSLNSIILFLFYVRTNKKYSIFAFVSIFHLLSNQLKW